jgi:FkbM family methyltransferase
MDKISGGLIRNLELEVTRFQGKGYGADTTKKEVKALKRFISAKDNSQLTVFDVGAHEGDYTREMLALFPQSYIYCFEPNSFSFDTLSSKFASERRVMLNRLALGEKNSSSDLHFDKKGSSLSSLVKRRLDYIGLDMNQSETVHVNSIDSYCKEYSLKPDIVKLDVEGLELSVLKGATATLDEIRIVQFEFGGANKDSKTFFIDFWEFFRKNNFDIFRITPSGPRLIQQYSELDEHFRTTNFMAVNSRLMDSSKGI